MKTVCGLVGTLILSLSVRAQANNPLLQSGPMLGYVDFREAQLWVQTKSEADVKIEYWLKDDPGRRWATATIRTTAENAFVAKPLANQVGPGGHYAYRVLINGKPQTLGYPAEFKTPVLWRDSNVPPDFSIAMGSCVYVTDTVFDDKSKRTYGGEYFIFESIHKRRPDMMFWLGDNVYLREPDWNTRTGIHYRYTQTRSIPELQPLLASTQHYATWDDHDFGPNDSDRSFVHKDVTLEAFKLFWANPSYGLPGNAGVTTQFRWGDVDFFVTDNRYHRAPQNRQSGDRTMLGKEQLEWLIDALVFSDARYKVVLVGTLVLSTASNVRNQNYISNYSEERAYLLKRIEEENLKNIIFVTGDKHFSELSKIVNSKGNAVYDFTVSPLTSRANTRNDVNQNRVEGTLVQERNFGMMEFKGSGDARKVILSIFDKHGNLKWTKTIPEE